MVDDPDPPLSASAQANAPRRGLNRLSGLRNALVNLQRWGLVRVWDIDIHLTAQLSLSAKMDRTFPIGVHVGANSYIAFEARILCHDRTRGLYLHTRVGENCFIGGRFLILPRVEVGDGCIVGAGAVVTKSLPPPGGALWSATQRGSCEKTSMCVPMAGFAPPMLPRLSWPSWG